MTEEQQDKPVRRKSKDRALLQRALEIMEMIDSDCRAIHTWQFHRQRSGAPDPHAFNRFLKELRDYLDNAKG